MTKQVDVLISYMKSKDNRTITVTEVVKKCGIGDPRSVIRDAIAQGWKISSEWKKGANRRGDRTRFKAYRLDSLRRKSITQ